MGKRKVLLMTKVDAVWERMPEFHEYWQEHNLPFWEQHGARHIGSFVNHVGGAKNQIIRLFEFDNLEQCQHFLSLRESMFESDQGREKMKELYPYLERIEESVWISAY